VFHNTVVKCGDGWGCYAGETWSRAFVRNNIFIGGTGGGTYGGYGNGTGRVLDLGDADATCSFDYDGLASIGTGTFEGKIGGNRFTSLATLQANTTEAHAVALDMTIFASGPAFPSNPYPVKATVDLQLAAGSAPVDKGVVLAGVNDGYTGAAPDLGAYELGIAPPVYGPRQGGATGTGGAVGTGGAQGIGGAPGRGGASGSGGVVGTGGAAGSGGAQGTGGDSPDGGTTTGKAKGCSCSTTGSTGGSEIVLFALLGLAGVVRLHRRKTQ
jgi:MYXO-CTERM domain-containing protein